DVFEQEPPGESPLVRHPRVIATPHLGASTEEAQRGIGIEVAEQVIAALAGRPAKGAVNAPVLQEDTWHRLEPFAGLMSALGAIAQQLAQGQLTGIEFMYEGEIAAEQTHLLDASFLVSLLAPILDQPVNPVNAAILGMASVSPRPRRVCVELGRADSVAALKVFDLACRSLKLAPPQIGSCRTPWQVASARRC